MFGLGGVDPRKMKAMMSQMGIKSEEIDSEEVIIKGKDKNIIIRNPSVTKINFSGQDMFQISGNAEETKKEGNVERTVGSSEEITEEDIETVANQTKASKEKARETLKKAGGDLASAIMQLKK